VSAREGLAVSFAAGLLLGTSISVAGSEVTFTDVTAVAGIGFTHESGAFGEKYLPETQGSGVAFLDFDGDGWQDLLFVNSMRWPGRSGPPTPPALYRNERDGTFEEVTRSAGLDVKLYGMGVAAADYDNDGDVDVLLTGLGANRLLRNLGGRFEDVTTAAGVSSGGFGTSAAFFDYDKDGRLDLFVANYVEWSVEEDLFCTLDGENKSYCTPESYRGQSPRLYRNQGGGRFEDVTERAGLANPSSKALGVALVDFDGDGWLDLFVANDTQPNNLYRNDGNGRFSDEGVTAGVAFSEAGVARAGMGVDAADYDGSGRPSLLVGNFSNEMIALYHNEGTGLFIDEAPRSELGRASLLSLTFACFFFDYDLDGLLDVFAVNGHVADDVEAVQSRVRYAQRPQLFRNTGGGRLEDVTSRSGAALQVPVVGRGAAYADFDNDGDLDVAITVNNGAARLLRNDGGSRNRFLRVRTIGSRSNRDGIGARVTVTPAGGSDRWRMVKTGSSYLSQSELTLTFGLGPAGKPARVVVDWPSGQRDVVEGVMPDQLVTIVEGEGVRRNAR
jgi:hypothetical protein